jgi:excisionase family DNA binding protein
MKASSPPAKEPVMTQNVVRQEILTLKEAARYLRLPPASLKKYAERGDIPGRQLGKEWRFLKSALNDWLGKPDSRAVLLQQFGALAGDPTLSALRKAIYTARGRPETEEGLAE